MCFSHIRIMFLDVSICHCCYLFRDGTDWDDMELSQLKENMAAEMREMVIQEKQRAIQVMAERNDAIRDITDGSSANLIEPRGYGEVSIDEQQVEQKKQAENDEMRAHMQAIMLSEKQHKIQEMAGRDAVLRDETTIINMKREVEEAEQEKVDILAEMQRIKREKLEEQFNKNFELVTEGTEDVVAIKIVIEEGTIFSINYLCLFVHVCRSVYYYLFSSFRHC
eukprot:89892_1